MNISDIIIHINETLNMEQRNSLEESMRQIDGVVSPHFNPGKDHLLAVAYNTDKTGSSALLASVRKAGYTAQLVGI